MSAKISLLYNLMIPQNLITSGSIIFAPHNEAELRK